MWRLQLSSAKAKRQEYSGENITAFVVLRVSLSTYHWRWNNLLNIFFSVRRNGLTAAVPENMHSRLQELKKEEETLLKIKIMLQDQLNRLKVWRRVTSSWMSGCVSKYLQCMVCIIYYCVCQFEEGELKSIINAQRGDGTSENPLESEVNHASCLYQTYVMHTKHEC